MKLEDEIQVIFKGLECGELYYIDSRRKSNASKEIKSLIERYCKRQRELCADELVYAYGEDYTIYGAIKENMIYKTKLATEE